MGAQERSFERESENFIAVICFLLQFCLCPFNLLYPSNVSLDILFRIIDSVTSVAWSDIFFFYLDFLLHNFL